MSNPITVGDIRKVIANLANDAVVLFGDIASPTTGYSVREIESIKTSHDGRYGSCLTMVVGAYAPPWGEQSYLDIDIVEEPRITPELPSIGMDDDDLAIMEHLNANRKNQT